jgi:class 3 adenylate cyclase
VFAVWNDAGYWVDAVDDQWRIVLISDELAAVASHQFVMGEFQFGPAQTTAELQGRSNHNTIENKRNDFARLGGWIINDLPGGRDALRAMVDPILLDLVDEIEPNDDDAIRLDTQAEAFGSGIGAVLVAQRVRNASGLVVGTLLITKPALGMNMIGMLVGAGDPAHIARMHQLTAAGRRPAAVLFADLEASTPLAKRLPTASYLRLVRHLTRAADESVVDGGGIVGRHAGDGFTAFFVAETLGSESAAAMACITVARALQLSTRVIAARNGLAPDEVTVRAGLHWGATLYVGSIITTGRTEVTALGDEVNEAARIEACATGGRLLASKELIERLSGDCLAALGIDPSRITYSLLADLDTATEKARRDAPAIAIYDLAASDS